MNQQNNSSSSATYILQTKPCPALLGILVRHQKDAHIGAKGGNQRRSRVQHHAERRGRVGVTGLNVQRLGVSLAELPRANVGGPFLGEDAVVNECEGAGSFFDAVAALKDARDATRFGRDTVLSSFFFFVSFLLLVEAAPRVATKGCTRVAFNGRFNFFNDGCLLLFQKLHKVVKQLFGFALFE